MFLLGSDAEFDVWSPAVAAWGPLPKKRLLGIGPLGWRGSPKCQQMTKCMSGDEVRRIGSSIVKKGLHITPYSRLSFPLVYLVMVQFKSNHRRVALACKPFFSLLAICSGKNG